MILADVSSVDEIPVAQRRTFAIGGMSCASCALSIENVLRKEKGVHSAVVVYADNSAEVLYEENIANADSIQKRIKDLGYECIAEPTPEERFLQEQQQLHTMKQRAAAAIALAAPVFAFGMFFHNVSAGPWISMPLTMLIIAFPGRAIFSNAVRQIKHRSLGMDTLVSLSVAVAFLFSSAGTLFPNAFQNAGLRPDIYFESAAVVLAFVILGKFLEEQARNRTGGAIRRLMQLQQSSATVERNGKEKTISSDLLVNDDVVLVRPGETIPADGIILSGSSAMDESPMTGESIPVEKIIGSTVLAGTLNLYGVVRFRATGVGVHTRLSAIIRAVRRAQAAKAPVQRHIDIVAAYFVPVIVAVSVLAFAIWTFALGDISTAITAFVSVLVVACPCAMGLAVPTALIAGIGRGAELGILIKDAEALQKASTVDMVAFDKTGTLTQGKPSVEYYQEISAVSNSDAEEIASVERLSSHPTAMAVTVYLENTFGISSTLTPETLTIVPGKGVEAIIRGHTYVVGTEIFLKEKGVPFSKDELGIDNSAAQDSKVFCAKNKVLLAIFGISDSPRAEAAEAIAAIHEKNVSTMMLTGDSAGAADYIGKLVQIQRIHARLGPEDKSKIIVDWKRNHRGSIAFAGDGINDAPALAAADVSIAMGSGADVALAAADIALTRSDLRAIAGALSLAKATMRIVRQNIGWAFIYNILCVPLAAGVLYPVFGIMLSPMAAGAAMALSSVSVVANSLRLRRFHSK